MIVCGGLLLGRKKTMTEAFTIRLAERNIKIQPQFSYVRDYCRDYLVDGQAELFVEISPSDIAYEREKSAREDSVEGIPIRQFSDEYLETLAVYRKIVTGLLDWDTVLFHGSAIAVDGKGYLFTAKSGTGKSTHTKLWRELFGDRAVMVNDDKPLLRMTDEGVLVYGTPWNGKHRLSHNISVPLKAICILTRDETNHIEPITTREAYPMLMQQSYRPQSPERMLQTMSLVDRLGKGVALYRLGCNMELSAAQVAYDGMNDIEE
jgi:hypothetical protein